MAFGTLSFGLMKIAAQCSTKTMLGGFELALQPQRNAKIVVRDGERRLQLDGAPTASFRLRPLPQVAQYGAKVALYLGLAKHQFRRGAQTLKRLTAATVRLHHCAQHLPTVTQPG